MIFADSVSKQQAFVLHVQSDWRKVISTEFGKDVTVAVPTGSNDLKSVRTDSLKTLNPNGYV